MATSLLEILVEAELSNGCSSSWSRLVIKLGVNSNDDVITSSEEDLWILNFRLLKRSKV